MGVLYSEEKGLWMEALTIAFHGPLNTHVWFLPSWFFPSSCSAVCAGGELLQISSLTGHRPTQGQFSLLAYRGTRKTTYMALGVLATILTCGSKGQLAVSERAVKSSQ